jgi:hypothetical protein
MRRLLAAGFLFTVLASVVLAEDAPFTQTIGTDDMAATGLDKLTPAQLSRLDALVSAYKSGELESARKSAEDALAAKKAAEAEAKAAKADAVATKQAAAAATKEAKAEVQEIKRTSLGFFSKAKIMLMPGTKVEYAVVYSTIPGKFEGWEGLQVFHLANGQTWQIANNGPGYYTQKQDIAVEVSPSELGGYWMRFPSLDQQVRVRLLSDH